METAVRVRFWVLAGLGCAGFVAAVVLDTVDSSWSAGSVWWMVFGVLPLYAIGTFVTVRRPGHPEALRLLVVGSSYAVGLGLDAWTHHLYLDRPPGDWFWLLNLVSGVVGTVGLVALTGMIALFPSGVADRPWMRRAVQSLWLLLLVPFLLLLTHELVVVDDWSPAAGALVDSPFTVSWLLWLGPVVGWIASSYAAVYLGLALLLWRYRRAPQEERVLMRGLVGVLVLSVALLFLVAAVAQLRGGPTWFTDLAIGTVSIMAMLLLSLTLVVGILRYQLFDIDVVLRRSAVFLALSWLIAGIYIAVAAAPGLALGGRVSVQVAVLLTMVVAVLFQPVRRRLEALADRWVFGRRVNRYELVRSFGTTLEMTMQLDALLPRLAATVRDGLGAPWVTVSLRGDQGEWLVDPQSVAGVPNGQPELSQELRRGDEIVGRIECGARRGGYTASDQELLETLAAQAAPVITNVGLTAQLAERLVELERSRARIFTAQELERRRIERDLHDGAQQEMVAILAKLGLARRQVERGELPVEVLGELQDDVLELLNDLRELAHGIHPAVLSDQGLVAAVEARADRLALPVTVHADDGLRSTRLGDDIEGAAYFIVCEALTNVVKHAGATSTVVGFAAHDNRLRIDVRDDGAGFSGANGHGTGLANMRDRVEALGGELEIRPATGGGTLLCAELPVVSLGAS